jgi:DEAD/DEAH box helicase domain-containing protein
MGAFFEGAPDLFNEPSAADPRARPCRTAEALVAALTRDHRARIVAETVVPARAARHAPFPDPLEPRLRAALEARGIRQLYSHQREAWEHVAAGHDTVVVTPTASGKTLCYNLPVLDAALKHGAKALYLFPTKALAQDQANEILALNAAGRLGVRAYTFDGDTPGDARRAVRTHGDLLPLAALLAPMARPTRREAPLLQAAA